MRDICHWCAGTGKRGLTSATPPEQQWRCEHCGGQGYFPVVRCSDKTLESWSSPTGFITYAKSDHQ